MSKVLIDRELLSALRSCTIAWADEYRWRNNLREAHDDHKNIVERAEAILAQPDDQASSETSLDTPLMIQRLGNRNKRIDELEASLSAVTAERDAMAKDAERYRWLREDSRQPVVVRDSNSHLHGTLLDARIDAALAAKEA